MSIQSVQGDSSVQVKLESHSFQWILKKFSKMKWEQSQSVKSCAFPCKSVSDTKFRLKLLAHHPDLLILYLELLFSKVCPITIKCTSSILDSKKIELNKRMSQGTVQLNGSIDLNLHILRSGLLNKFLPDDELVLHCEIIVYATIEPIQVPKCEMLVNLSSLLGDTNFSDVVLCAGDIEFPAHKNIMACRSPIFEAMFTHDMQEKKENRVIFKDIEPETMRELLSYIYTGQVNLKLEMATKLLPAADKYDLRRLKTMCEKIISDNLSIETAADYLLLSDFCNAQRLKDKTLDFICVSPHEVVKTDNWKLVMNAQPHLSEDCFERILLREVMTKQFEILSFEPSEKNGT